MLCSSPWSRFELTASVVIGTDCTGSCKSNYHSITATTAPPDCRRKSKENNDNKTGQISLHMGPSWWLSVIVYGKMIYNYQRIQCLPSATKNGKVVKQKLWEHQCVIHLIIIIIIIKWNYFNEVHVQCTVKPVLRGHLWDKEKVKI